MSPALRCSRIPRQHLRMLAVLALALAGSWPATRAGQAGSPFSITIHYTPEGTGVCSAGSGSGAPQVTCRPVVPTVTSPTGGSAGPDRKAAALGYRLPEQPLKLAGEMVELNDENHYAWADNNYFALGEYSSRLVSAGGVEYVEMTVSW
ncbi:MAG TPA: hypothetical protein VGD76_07735 [Ramlibacter sp.]